MKGLLSVLGPYTWELQITHYFFYALCFNGHFLLHLSLSKTSSSLVVIHIQLLFVLIFCDFMFNYIQCEKNFFLEITK